MSEPQLQQRPASLTALPPLEQKSHSPSLRTLSKPSAPARGVDFLSRPLHALKVSSLPTLRRLPLGTRGPAESSALQHAKSAAAFQQRKRAGDNPENVADPETEKYKGFSRELLGLPRRNAEGEAASPPDDGDKTSLDHATAEPQEMSPAPDTAATDDTSNTSNLNNLTTNESIGKHSAGDPKLDVQGHFTHPLFYHPIKRTDNAFLRPWAATKPVASELAKPGVLEIDADAIKAPIGTLEPIRAHRTAPINSMHPYTDEECKVLSRIESRFDFLPNPRFPHTKDFLKKRASSDPHSSAQPPVFVPPGIDKRWLSKEAPTERRNGAAPAEGPGNLGILAIPAQVVFTDYAPNQTYEKEVELKNVTQNSHRFRLSEPPPYTHTPYFTLKLISAPADHGKDGLVAPGMSLRYRVTFRPNSLANFRQIFILSTEVAGRSLPVPFIAQREAPRLTLPAVLDCGPTRAGYDNVRAWNFKNEGGPGRFLIVPEHKKVDPYTVFDTMEETAKYATASSPPFDIFPAFLTLKKGETGQIVVRYSPPALEAIDPLEVEDAAAAMAAREADGGRRDEVLFKLVCDNCTIFDFPLEGLAQDPGIQISGVHRLGGVAWDADAEGLAPPGTGSNGCDLYVPFGKQNPGATTLYAVTIRNTSRLRLPFQWNISNAPSDNSGAAASIDTLATAAAAFQIIPLRGWLPPSADMTFEVAFTPQETKYFDVRCKLNLLYAEKHQQVVVAPGDNASSTGSLHGQLSGLSSGSAALSVRCTGQGVPFHVTMSPEIIMIPGVLYTGSTYSTVLHATNESVSDVAFEWDADDVNENVLDVRISTTAGVILPWTCSSIKLQCLGVFPGTVRGTLNCVVAHGPTIRVPIVATVALAPDALRFDTALVDFGLLALGSLRTVKVALVSTAPITLRWRVNGHKRGASRLDEADRDCHMTYQPSQGTIMPGATQIIKITYVPVWYQSLNAVLECSIIEDCGPPLLYGDVLQTAPEAGTNASTEQPTALATPSAAATVLRNEVAVAAVEMRAEVQTPRATIVDPVNALTCFLDVPSTYIIDMRNIRMLPAEFRWRDVDCDEYSVSFIPQAGKIPGGEVAQIKVRFIGHRNGSLSNLLFACHIKGMVEHGGYLGIKLDAEVFGVNVELKLEQSTDVAPHEKRPELAGTLAFDFGEECPIFAKRQATLVIRNRTAISAPFRIFMEKYEATALKGDDELIAEPAIEEGGVTTQNLLPVEKTPAALRPGIKTPLLPASNVEKLGFSSKTGMDYIFQIKEVRRMIKRMHALLREGRGAAFHSSPSNTTIGPWGTVRVKVTSYNNLVGLYEDNLICDVRGWDKQVIPIRLGVVGLPVRFSGAHLVARPKGSPADTIDRVNFGTRITNLTWASVDGVRAYAFPRSDRTEEEALQLGDLEAHSKVINIENQSPRDIRLTWVTYIKHTELAGPVPTIEDILVPQNRLDQDALGLFGVSPATMVVPAFKTTSIRIFFRSAMVGTFDALLVADVGYVQKDGKPLYGHGRKESTRRPGTDDEAFPASHLTSMACVHVQGRAIEPHLSLDIGDRIRMKETFWGPHDDGGPSLSGSEGRTVNVFLQNTTDSVCSFTMYTAPRGMFAVKTAEDAPRSGSGHVGKKAGKSALKRKQVPQIIEDTESILYELKPTEQMLLSVRFTPHPHPGRTLTGGADDPSSSRARSSVGPPSTSRPSTQATRNGIVSASGPAGRVDDASPLTSNEAVGQRQAPEGVDTQPPAPNPAETQTAEAAAAAAAPQPAVPSDSGAAAASEPAQVLPDPVASKDGEAPAAEMVRSALEPSIPEDPEDTEGSNPLPPSERPRSSVAASAAPESSPPAASNTPPSQAQPFANASPALPSTPRAPLSARAAATPPHTAPSSATRRLSNAKPRSARPPRPASTNVSNTTPKLATSQQRPEAAARDRPDSAAPPRGLRTVAEGTLNIVFANGIRQSIPIVVEETT
ncbi:Deleted in lung and esophageal cancer protein 1 [Geranomyces variabilis]|uniref:Deleted in lung and esophageal cancer protein 1 n=1 Tax=Geranomyces variabilis TaxID=109894 RepID=A0AAD5TPS3_9FUNG|nr:Deleted in lung and esophageal cancer protein 1 [Geranomyces variabilis]